MNKLLPARGGRFFFITANRSNEKMPSPEFLDSSGVFEEPARHLSYDDCEKLENSLEAHYFNDSNNCIEDMCQGERQNILSLDKKK